LLQGGNKVLIETLHTVSPIQQKLPSMLQTKFCSQCGDRRKGMGQSLIGFATYCRPCKKRMRLARFARAAILIGLAAGSFFAGRATTPRPTFQFIGQPIEPGDRAAGEIDEGAAMEAAATAEAQTTAAQEEVLTPCGAPTKAGRPCRRKVRGSGYCWQHKDNFKGKTNASP
jgi:hypothetical protein